MRILLGLLLVVVLAVAVAVGVVWWQARADVAELRAGAKVSAVASAERVLGTLPPRLPAAVPRAPVPHDETILVLTTRRQWGVRGGETESILLLRLMPHGRSATLLTVPPDARVEGTTFAAAFASGGEQRLIATLRDFLGVPIDHVIEVNARDLREPIATVAQQLVAARFDPLRLRSLLGKLAHATASDFHSFGALWRLAETVRHVLPGRTLQLVLPARAAAGGRTVDRWLRDQGQP